MSPEWHAWYNMHYRCYNTRASNYHNYGGRGVAVCEQWFVYETFLLDMGKRPGTHFSLERIDNDGNYEPSNCRWATASEQTQNRRGDGIHFVQKNNTSGIIGVGYRASVGRWEAYVREEYTQRRLYWGKDFFEACCARKSWEAHRVS